MQNNTTLGAAEAGLATRRPRVAAGVVSVAGLAVGFVFAYFATELAHSLTPASPIFISATAPDLIPAQG